MKPLHISLAAAALLAGFSLAITLTSATARTWTNKDGRKIEAELEKIETSANGKIAHLKMAANGQVYPVPLDSLSEEDVAFIQEHEAASASTVASESTSSAEPSVFAKELDGRLVRLNGKKIESYEMAKEPEMYAFYFSAHWCGPCRAFTPALVEFYNEHKEDAGDKFELIFVSSDHDERSQEEYIEGDEMPWPAIKFRYADRVDQIRKLCGSGIPCLVLTDREGKVLSDSFVDGKYVGPTKVMGDLEAKLK